MEKVLFEGKTEFADYIKLIYMINDGEFTMAQYIFSKEDKTKLFGQKDFKATYSFTIDKWFSQKLLDLISEEEIREKYGNENGFLDFQDFCNKKKIEMHFAPSELN